MKKIVKILGLIAISASVLTACTKPAKTTPKPGKVESPVAAFTYEVNGLEVQFTNNSTNATAFQWNFGDGNNSTEKSPKHVYASAGDYTVSLVAANDEGTTSKKEESISLAGAPKAYFAFSAQTDRNGKYGKVINFDATSSENATSISWDFGDGQGIEEGTEFKPVHEFAEYGLYTVKATVKNAKGESNEFSQEIDVKAYNELIKGGAMEAEDASYWTFVKKAGYYIGDDDYAEVEGTSAWEPEFGYKGEMTPSKGEGACLKLDSKNQNHDWGYKVAFYQGVDLAAGDSLDISAALRWGKDVNDNGIMFLCVTNDVDAFGTDPTAILEVFNWWGVVEAGVDPANPERHSTCVPEYDGDLSGTGLEGDYGYSGNGTPIVGFKAPADGTYYIGFEIRSVWGLTFGPGHDYYFDNISAKIIL